MIKYIKRGVVTATLVFMILTLMLPVCGLQWIGSSTGGGGGGTAAEPDGYAVRTTADNCIGYRFSIVDKTGANKVSKVIDVFRDTSNGSYAYSTAYKFATKYNKKQLIGYQNGSFSTSKTTTNCYKEANMGFADALPTPAGMETWQASYNNLNPVLTKLGAGSVSTLNSGDKILVEPLYDVSLQGTYHSITVTEIAIYGKYILGSSSDGGWSYTSASWGFIAEYTNMHYPNSLYTTNGMGLWSNAKALDDQDTFYNIINSGYGVGIAYTETKSEFSPNLSIYCCEAWQGNSGSKTKHFGTSYGSTAAEFTLDKDYPIMGDKIWFYIHFPKESENCYVKQTVWIEGGGSTSRKVYTNSGTWYAVGLSPTTVPESAESYIIKARVDWINSDGTVKKYGVQKTFYIPIRPKINRYQVSMFGITGARVAYSGSTGTNGAVYIGQQVRAKYKYTSDNSWTSYNNLWAAMHKWRSSSGDWVRVLQNDPEYGDTDGKYSKAALSKTTSKTLDSYLGYVTVPDNSGAPEGNCMHFKMTTKWTYDPINTAESTWIDIPILTADVELSNIRLIGEDGNYVDPHELYAGQKITVQYTYKNNTGCTVYVNGYDNEANRISGIYSIPKNGTINVNGYTFEVPRVRHFQLWGGVYLDGVPIYDTEYESDGDNNEMYLDCVVTIPLTLEPIAPNASYRESTDVITSYWLNNPSIVDYTPYDGITLQFEVYTVQGELISFTEKDAIVPKEAKNLVYFKWTVSENVSEDKVVIVAKLYQEGVLYYQVSREYDSIPYEYYVTPDTNYEDSAPEGFSVPDKPINRLGYATWHEYAYVYETGTFEDREYGIGVSINANDVFLPVEEFNEGSDDAPVMKSGYAVTVTAKQRMSAVGYTYFPGSKAYTKDQYVYVMFPEYGYSSGEDVCRTMIKSGNEWNMPENGSYGNVHFTPLYYPDTEYYIAIIKSDCWTPAGMIWSRVRPTAIIIKGAAYDDWYVGRQ